jgi:hypothetical protein
LNNSALRVIGLYALAEMACAVMLGGFFLIDRAEPWLFLAIRPWLLLVLLVVLARQPWPMRWAIITAALLLANLSIGLMLTLLGNALVWRDLLWGVGGGLLLAMLWDGLAQSSLRLANIGFVRAAWRGPAAGVVAGLAGLALLAWPGGPLLKAYQAVILPNEPVVTAPPIGLSLLTGLPLVWGEADEPPPHILGYLKPRFAITIADTPGQALRLRQPLLVAQSRPWLAAELVMLDRWISAGGRAVLLSDPALGWHSAYGLGNPRRPPGDDGLQPLAQHWGLIRRVAEQPATMRQDIIIAERRYRITVAGAGQWQARDRRCQLLAAGLIADCRIGAGRAIWLADADLLHDLLWAGPGAGGTSQLLRTADNGPLLRDLLLGLAGEAPDSRAVSWISQPNHWLLAALAGWLPGLSLLLYGLWRRRATQA